MSDRRRQLDARFFEIAVDELEHADEAELRELAELADVIGGAAQYLLDERASQDGRGAPV